MREFVFKRRLLSLKRLFENQTEENFFLWIEFFGSIKKGKTLIDIKKVLQILVFERLLKVSVHFIESNAVDFGWEGLRVQKHPKNQVSP